MFISLLTLLPLVPHHSWEFSIEKEFIFVRRNEHFYSIIIIIIWLRINFYYSQIDVYFAGRKRINSDYEKNMINTKIAWMGKPSSCNRLWVSELVRAETIENNFIISFHLIARIRINDHIKMLISENSCQR
jgi:hypothetical protein